MVSPIIYKNVTIIDIYIFSGYGDVKEDYEEIRAKLNSTKHKVFQIDTSLPVHKCFQCNSKPGASLSSSHVATLHFGLIVFGLSFQLFSKACLCSVLLDSLGNSTILWNQETTDAQSLQVDLYPLHAHLTTADVCAQTSSFECCWNRFRKHLAVFNRGKPKAVGVGVVVASSSAMALNEGSTAKLL